jgi:hypothetical protein
MFEKRNTLFSVLAMLFSFFALVLLLAHMYREPISVVSPLPEVSVTPIETSTVSGTLTPSVTVVEDTVAPIRRATPTEVEPTLVPVQ